jgi:hypothetical protein
MPTVLKLLHKTERERTLPHYEASITLNPKPEKDTTKNRELQANLVSEHGDKILNKNICKPNSPAYQKDHTRGFQDGG